MINPFVICDVAFQNELQQYADQERWEYQCRALGAMMNDIQTYTASAYAYARTTIYPNSDVIAYARRVALEALARGEPMPVSVETAIEADNARQLLRLIGDL